MTTSTSTRIGRSATVSDGHTVKTEISSESRDGSTPLATFLGLFSVGLGLWELMAPRQVAAATGVRSQALIQGYGARELGAGLGILTTPRPAGWLR